MLSTAAFPSVKLTVGGVDKNPYAYAQNHLASMQQDGCSNVIVVGITGASCSGKTSLACELQKCLHHVIVLHQDDFYKDVCQVPKLATLGPNWDSPDALDIGRFEKSLNEIEQHPYLHCGHCQSEKTVGTKHIVVLEGTMILKLETFKQRIHIRVFIEIERDMSFLRRSQKTYSYPDIPGYFAQILWPTHEADCKALKMDFDSGKLDIEFLDGRQSILDMTTKVKDIINKHLRKETI